MADISISLNNIRNTKTLFVEDLDASFVVRKLGAGEELDLSDKMRRLGVILGELQSIDFTGFDLTKEEDIKELEKIRKRASKLSDEVNDIQRFELETYKRCFTSEKGEEMVSKLLNELSVDDRSNLFKQLFDTVKPLETKEDATNAVVPESDSETSQEASSEVKE